MSRPSISPTLLASLTEAAPGRLVRKLDKKPELAEAWVWAQDGATTTVTTPKGPIVTLTGQALTEPEHVGCDCLLAPKCLHLLAVVSRLELATAALAAEPERVDDDALPEVEHPQNPGVVLDEEQALAVSRMHEATMAILAVGARRAGAVRQAGLLRAIHAARLAKVPRVAAAATRVLSGVRDLREGKVAPGTQAGLAELVHHTRVMSAPGPVPRGSVGVSRRTYAPGGNLTLYGVACEAVSGRHGYAGVTTYLWGPKAGWATLSTVRPAEMGGPVATYQKGVDFAEVAASHARVGRSKLIVQNATRSPDGRLGRGKGVKAILRDALPLWDPVFAPLFARPLAAQVATALALRDEDPLLRPAGYDLVAFEGRIVAASDEGVWWSTGEGRPMVHARQPELGVFADLELRCVAKVDLRAPRTIHVLAIAHPELVMDAERQGRMMVDLDGISGALVARTPPALDRLGVPVIRRPHRPLERTLDRVLRTGARALPAAAHTEVDAQAERMRANGLHEGAARLRDLWSAAQAPAGSHAPDPARLAQAWTAAHRYVDALDAAVVARSWR